MTPELKARELVDKFLPNIIGADRYNYNLESMNLYISKQCALIAVDEIMKECDNWRGGTNDGWDTRRFDYWEQVKQEIEKL